MCINFTAINEESFNKNLFLKIFKYLPENTCVVSLFFYKVTGFYLLGLQHRCFLVNNVKFLRIHTLKNICEPFTSAFLKSIVWTSWKKKTILKTKWQKLINKYENAFIWTLHVAMKRNHWNVSLNQYYIFHLYIPP